MHKGQKMPEWVKRKISKSEKSKIVSQKTRQKISRMMIGQINEKCRNWVGDKVGYCGIHDWLKKNFGKANKCENFNCLNKSKLFDWAKLKDKEYQRKRENFWMLCKSCHIKYDMTDEKRKKISETLKNKKYAMA